MSHIETLQIEDHPHQWAEVQRQSNGLVEIRKQFRTKHPRHRIDGQMRYHTDNDGEVTAVTIHTFEGEYLLAVANPAPVREYLQA